MSLNPAPEPLRLPSLEAKAKRVHRAKSYRVSIDLKGRPDLLAAYTALVRAIENGWTLPERFYRKDRHSTPDRLLEDEGVMHLHLGDQSTPELVYLMQFDNDVVLLEVSDHYHFTTTPPGSQLYRLHKLPPMEWHQAELDKRTEALAKLTRTRGK